MLDELQQIQEQAELLYSNDAVIAALDRMASEINAVLAETNPILLCVLNGGIPVAGQLLTRLTMPLNLDAVNASRYRNQTVGGTINWLLKPSLSLQGRVVLIVDDVLDEGITLAAIHQYCKEQQAAAIYSAVLVDKQLDRDKPVHADFVGLTVPNRYIFGYGMDYQGYCRNAAGIYACRGR